MEHTKGKWELDNLAIYVTEFGGGRLWIATVCVGLPKGQKEETANARLIAAAPDLLAACLMAREWLGSDIVATSEAQEQMDKAIAAAYVAPG